jgi:hypothetical protein
VAVADRPTSTTDHIIASYRYLRLANVIVVVILAASLAVEIFKASCWQTSISGYYYTPVHAVFIGVLFAIGVSLIALKGRDDLEDLCFNLAGVLAPVVALVPTGRPGTVCSRRGEDLTLNTTGLFTNNIPAVLVGAALAIAAAYTIAAKKERVTVRAPRRSAFVGILLSVVLLVAGGVWYFADGDGFEHHAHTPAAIAMFVAIWLAVLVNAGWPRPVLRWLYRALRLPEPTDTPTDRQLWFRARYGLVAIAMVVGAAVYVVALLVGWDHRVFALEAIEIGAFAVFWSLQTAEGWDDGAQAPTPA